MTTDKRWIEAQAYERGFWKTVGEKIKSGENHGLDFYKWRAQNLQETIANALPQENIAFENSTIVEVGCGAVGPISHLEAKSRYAFDPLNSFYETIPELVEFRDPGVKYETSKGEKLPADDAIADLTIMENVIDHVQNDASVMQELYRITKPNALLFFTVNCHPKWGGKLHEIFSSLKIDRGHPHTFTLEKVQNYLPSFGFEILWQNSEDYKECRMNDWKSDSKKDKLKATLGLSEFLFTAVCRKK